MVQEEEGEENLDRTCEKRRSSSLRKVKEEWNIKHTIKRRNPNRRSDLVMNCLLKNVIEEG
jgi:hypothetical protein